MKIELSPGEWAGVMNVLHQAAEDMRQAAAVEPIEDFEAADLREQADDYERIEGIIREALDKDGRGLPVLTPPEVPEGEEVEATCQHVWTVEEIEQLRQRDAEWQAALRETHPTYVPTERTYPEPGSLCGSELIYWTGVPYRHYAYWSDSGVLVMGDGKSGDGDIGEDELVCSNHVHAWAIPDDVDWM